MRLRNNKVTGVEDNVLDRCIEYLPRELLREITDFHHCLNCFENNYIHCTHCNNCVEQYKKHYICNKCNICYPAMKSVIFANRRYDFVVNKHIHCDICDTIKKYSMINYMYYCENCSEI